MRAPARTEAGGKGRFFAHGDAQIRVFSHVCGPKRPAIVREAAGPYWDHGQCGRPEGAARGGGGNVARANANRFVIAPGAGGRDGWGGECRVYAGRCAGGPPKGGECAAGEDRFLTCACKSGDRFAIGNGREKCLRLRESIRFKDVWFFIRLAVNGRSKIHKKE